MLRVHPIPTEHPRCYSFFLFFFVATLCVNKDVYITQAIRSHTSAVCREGGPTYLTYYTDLFYNETGNHLDQIGIKGIDQSVSGPSSCAAAAVVEERRLCRSDWMQR